MPTAPDWVMLGVPRGDEFAIYASTDLTRGELESRLLNERDLYVDLGGSPYYGRSTARAIYEFTISATMRTYVVVIGPSYAEALRTLLTKWQPQPPDRPQIEAVSASDVHFVEAIETPTEPRAAVFDELTLSMHYPDERDAAAE